MGAAEVHDVLENGLNPFLDDLYEAALEPNRLRGALDSFARAFGAKSGRVYLKDLWAGSAGGQLLDLAGAGAIHDLRADDAACERLLDLLARRGSEGDGIYSGTLDVQSVGGWPPSSAAVSYLALIAALDERWVVGLVALRDNAAFSYGETARAREALSDVKRALGFHLKAAGNGGFGFGDRVFNASSIALFVTRQKSIEHANDMGGRVLRGEGPVKLSGRCLHFDDSRAQAAFDLVSKPDAKGAPPPRSYAFIVSGTAGDTWLAQISRHRPPAESPLFVAGGSAPLVATVLTPFNTSLASRETVIEGFIDLTVTERSILSALVGGKDIGRIANDTSRSVETVRWHVRNLFTKLGVNSQTDLARLGTLLLPI